MNKKLMILALLNVWLNWIVQLNIYRSFVALITKCGWFFLSTSLILKWQLVKNDLHFEQNRE